MFINYYFVKGCTYQPYHEKDVIFAPDGTDEHLLHQCGFQQAEDGRYFKILNQEEYKAIMKGYPHNDIIFSDETPEPLYQYQDMPPQNTPIIQKKPPKKKQDFWEYFLYIFDVPNILCMLSLILTIALFVVCAVLREINNIPSCILGLISLILIITVRVRYPENIFGKVLMVLYGIICAGILLLMIYALWTCFSMCIGCLSCSF
ncbi:MAG: hypothetical protein IJ644_02675 [Oscillospiraceae bacterium]|nr:hypothetical protein [Oscillospiraceae bacterium]